MKDIKQIIPLFLICTTVIVMILVLFGLTTNITFSRLYSPDFVISILSLLITILIGWQIFTVINFKAETEKQKEECSAITKKIENIHQISYDAYISAYYGLYIVFNDSGKVPGAITSIILGLDAMAKIDLAGNHKAGNINRFIDYLDKELHTETSAKWQFGKNNIAILEEKIKDIQENSDYHYIEDKLGKLLKQVEEIIQQEKKEKDKQQ